MSSLETCPHCGEQVIKSGRMLINTSGKTLRHDLSCTAWPPTADTDRPYHEPRPRRRR